MHDIATELQESRQRSAGEPFVWVTSVGLSIGVLMVVGLLAVIASSGAKVFWPKRVVQITLDAASGADFQGGKQFAGVLIKSQPRIVQTAPGAATEHEGRPLRESQFYVGNKDAYGFNFSYLHEEAIAQREYPPELVVMERLEYGDAIGYFVALAHPDGSRTLAGAPEFSARLSAAHREALARSEELRRIEKGDIGRINYELERLALQRKSAAGSDAAEIDAQSAQLQADYEKLASAATELRKRQAETQIVYRLSDGPERTLPLGQLVSFHYPNRLGLAERLGLFTHRLWNFLSAEPREANTEGGVFPAIFGTFVMTLLMSIAVTPFGVLAAIYLREYAQQGVFVRAVRIAVNNLAGVPSIVFGVFGLGFFVYLVGGTLDSLFYHAALPTPTFGTGGILWAALTLALMTAPVVIVATEEALSAISRGMREASLACGASKWQTMQRIVLPAAIPGILTGLILAMARGAGEVAPLMLVGVVKLAPNLPLDAMFPFFHLERKFMHLGFHIYDLGFQSPDSEAAKPMVFATTALLIALVVVLNLGAILLRERLRRKYSTGAF
jgi:phosphate transport system permease protein